MELWLKVYKEQGIEAMSIGSKSRKSRKRKINNVSNIKYNVNN
ncbi:MAG: hypothetical protein ACK5H1_09510 [Tenacibaculum sp.]